MTRTLIINQPFDLAVTLEMGQAFRWRRVGDESAKNRDWGSPPPFWRTGGGGWYSGVLYDYLVHLRQTPEGLEYRVGSQDGERTDEDLTTVLSRYFRLDDEIDSIYAQMAIEPTVARSIARYKGLRLLRQDKWECLASYLCSGNNSIRGIMSCVENIAQLSRRRVVLDEEERYVFPSAQDMVDEGLSSLRDLQLGLDRADSILRMAAQVANQPLLLERMANPAVSGLQAVTVLDSYRGMGPRTASCVALMSLDKPDAFPVDRWIQRGLARCDLTSMRNGAASLADRVRSLQTLTESQQYQVAKWAREHFGEYAGYVGQYLFHWVEPHKERVMREGRCLLCDQGRL